MSDELVFYTNPLSRGRFVRWMLEEVGQPYRTEIVDYEKIRDPAYLAINPMGKLPSLVHGSAVVTECAAICAYLADAFPAARLAPLPGDPARGAYYRWLFFAAGPVEAATTNKTMGFEVTAEGQRMAGYGSYERTLAVLEAAVKGRDHLAGDRFSAADVYVGSHIGFGLRFGWLEKRPPLVAYWEAVSSRPAAKRAEEIDNAIAPLPG